MVSTIAAFLLIIIYFVTDKRFRTDKSAQQLTLSASDRSSTSYLLVAYGISILLLLISPLLNLLHVARYNPSSDWGWLGILLMLLGIGLRAWATRVLGRFYTRTLVTTADHRVVQEGPYRLIRHPGYTGSLLVWIGAGLAVTNWLVFALVALICVTAYLYRIRSEEAMLTADLGQAYLDYRQRTKRLIPYIF